MIRTRRSVRLLMIMAAVMVMFCCMGWTLKANSVTAKALPATVVLVAAGVIPELCRPSRQIATRSQRREYPRHQLLLRSHTPRWDFYAYLTKVLFRSALRRWSRPHPRARFC